MWRFCRTESTKKATCAAEEGKPQSIARELRRNCDPNCARGGDCAHLALLPVEPQLDVVPLVRDVRRRAVRDALRAEQPHLPVLGELELRHPLVHLVRLAEDEVAGVGAAVVGAHVERDGLRLERAVEGRRVLRLGVLGERARRLRRPAAAVVVGARRRRGQPQRHPEVGVVAALEVERRGRAVGRAHLGVEAVLVVAREERRAPQPHRLLLEPLRQAHLRGDRAHAHLLAQLGERLPLVVDDRQRRLERERRRQVVGQRLPLEARRLLLVR